MTPQDLSIADLKAVKQDCPEFPYFGARYNDARCIEGYLWDLDKCDNDKNLYGGGEIPCPFCNTKEFIKYHIDPLNGITRKKINEWVAKLKDKYSPIHRT